MAIASVSIVALVALFTIATLVASAATLNTVFKDLPSVDTLPLLMNPGDGELLQPTRLLDRTGAITLFTYQDINSDRVFLSVDPAVETHFSPQLIRVVTAGLTILLGKARPSSA